MCAFYWLERFFVRVEGWKACSGGVGVFNRWHRRLCVLWKELEGLDDNVELVALFALVVFPGVVSEAAFDEEGAALTAVLLDDLAAASEAGELDVGGLFALLAGLRGVAAIYGETEVADFIAGGECFELGVAGEIAHENDFVHIGYN